MAYTADAAIKDREALELRNLGWTYQRIADHLSVSVSTAFDRVQRAVRNIPAEAVDEHRRIEGERMDNLLATYMPQALAGDVKSADFVLKVLDRRAKLLGLDAPTKTEVITLDAIDAEIRRLETQLGENDVAGTRTAGETTQA
jgi:hypothetical protein